MLLAVDRLACAPSERAAISRAEDSGERSWPRGVATAPGVCSADVNGDGVVDTADFGILLDNYLRVCQASCDGGGEQALMQAVAGSVAMDAALAELGWESREAHREWLKAATAAEIVAHLEELIDALGGFEPEK